MIRQYKARTATWPDKGKPLERAGRKAADLNPERDTVAGPPGEYSTSRTAYRFGRKKVQEVQTVKGRNVTTGLLKQPLARACMLILLVLMAAFALPPSPVDAAQATLSWQAPTTYTDGTPVTSLSGYKVYLGTASGSYSQTIDVGNSTSYTFDNLNDASKYFFATTAYDASGNASGFSTEVSYTTPAPPPSSNLYTLTASAGSGGSISPSGSVVVSQGLNQSYAITPNPNYYIVSVSVDGTVVASNVITYSYTFSNVTANHTISASFAYCTKLITATSGTGGTISPTSVYVNVGSSQTFTITPSTGYNVAGVTVDGVSVGAVTSYTFSNVTVPHTISATFAANTVTSYSITASAGTNGSISPSGTVSVAGGTNKSFTITPNTGYKVAGVMVDGVSVGAVSSYTFSNVNTTHTVAATFSANTVSANIPHTNWKLKYADSQETVGQNGAATNAFDGNTGTIWHTQWNTSSPACPHEIQINLGKSYTLNSFSYLPRQDGSLNGTIANYEFYVSTDGVNWGTPVAKGTFANNANLKQVSFAAKKGQYIRLRALSEVNGKPWTSMAEINVTGN